MINLGPRPTADSFAHVIASDMLSPNETAPTAGAILN